MMLKQKERPAFLRRPATTTKTTAMILTQKAIRTKKNTDSIQAPSYIDSLSKKENAYNKKEGCSSKNQRSFLLYAHASDFIDFVSINSDIYIWKRLLNKAYRKMFHDSLSWNKFYNKFSYSENIEKNMYMKCVLCGEKTRDGESASFFQLKDGQYFYHDFHTGESYNIVEFFHALKTGKPRRLVAGAPETKKAFIEFYNWLEEEKIDTRCGLEFSEWWNKYRSSIRSGFEFKNQIIGNSFLEMIFKVLDALMKIAQRQYNKGLKEFLASTNHIIEVAGLEKTGNIRTKVNRALNFWVLAGLIEKGANKSLKNGRTYYYSVNFKFIPEVAKDTWSMLEEFGIANFRGFKKANIAKFFGESVANRVFRAKPDNQVEEQERETPGGVNDELESASYQRFSRVEDTGNEGRPEFLGNDTNKRTAGSVISLAVGFSDSGGVRSRAGTS